jgi:hypothetical protein
MKKRIALTMLVVLLVLVFVGGSVYGRGDQSRERGDKIIGHGMLGSLIIGEEIDESLSSIVWFTNPDCENDIAINKVSIIRMDGTVIYKGPYVMMPAPGAGDYEIVNVIKPHEIRALTLGRYIWTGASDPADPTDPNNWMSEEEATALPWAAYTVEIFWEPVSKKGATLPLTGWISTRTLQHHAGDHSIIFASVMINMTQR